MTSSLNGSVGVNNDSNVTVRRRRRIIHKEPSGSDGSGTGSDSETESLTEQSPSAKAVPRKVLIFTHVYLMYSSCISHAFLMYFSCISHVFVMYFKGAVHK